MIWHIRFINDFGPRIFCVHAQDMDLDEETCYQHGILSAGIGVQQRRIPGMGRVNWQEVVKALYNVGYDNAMKRGQGEAGFSDRQAFPGGVYGPMISGRLRFLPADIHGS